MGWLDVSGGQTYSQSDYSGESNKFEKTCDDVLDTYWTMSNPGYPAWGKVELGNPKIVEKFGVYVQTALWNSTIDDFKLQGSNNDSDWDDLVSVSDYNAAGGDSWDYWQFSNTTAYTYYRLYVTDADFPTGNCYLTEIELLERVPIEFSEDLSAQTSTSLMVLAGGTVDAVLADGVGLDDTISTNR